MEKYSSDEGTDWYQWIGRALVMKTRKIFVCLFAPSFKMPENYSVLRPVEQIVAVRGNCGKFPGL